MIVTLLTDYGYEDEFAGVCHGVIQRICPGCRVIDVTHGIPPQDVRRGAVTLRNALPYMPAGVHVAVVDPGVGGQRRALALGCEDGRALVGPDNGVLSLAWEQFGGVATAVDVSSSPYRLEPLSATFHGRDVFCPVAAQLARGISLEELGEAIEPDCLATLELPAPRVTGGEVVAGVIDVDRFGNLALNLGRRELEGTGLGLGDSLEVEVGGRARRATFVRSFGELEPGELLLYEDANRALALAVNRGDAATALGAAPGDEVRLTPR